MAALQLTDRTATTLGVCCGQGDWGSVGETAIPGCSLWFTLSVWENLMKVRHLFRSDEIVSAIDVLPGMQV